MDQVYLKDLKSFSVSEVMSFREKFIELINKLAQEAETNDDIDEKTLKKRRILARMSTKQKIKRKNTKMLIELRRKKNCRRTSKPELKDMTPLLPLTLPDDISTTRKRVHDLVPHKDVAFVFRVYSPFVYQSNDRSRKRHSMEIVMLGHQTLNLLCDKIICGEGYMEVGGDISETPDVPVKQRLGEKYKSRMLYIGNTFYVDKANPANIDYSESIRNWGARNGIELGETFDMHECTCLDLVARIGFPYVYQHLGGCEHVLRIEYVRLVEEKDCLESSLYPFYIYVAKGSTKLCMACMELSEWIIFDSARMISNPSYLCNTCFRSYHYVDGKKIGSFKAVRYWDCPVFSDMSDRICCKSNTSIKKEKIDLDT